MVDNGLAARLGLYGASGFNPAAPKDAGGNTLLVQNGYKPNGSTFESKYGKGTRRTGQQGRCYSGDATNDFVNFGNIIDAPSALTMCLWWQGSTLSAGKGLAGKWISGTGYTLFGNSGTPKAQINSTVATATTNITDNVPHHVAMTWDGSTVKIWIDGVEEDSAAVSTITGNSNDLQLITYNGTFTSAEGKFWDFRVYTRALTASEITYLASNTKLGTDPTLTDCSLWAKCDEQAGTTSYDSSGNGNNGTITNATLSTFHATQDVYSFQNNVGYSDGGSGVFVPRDESDTANDVLGNPLDYTGVRPNDGALINSNCLTLNGTNQAVRVADNTDLDITDNLTVMFWAKNANASLVASEVIAAKYDFANNRREWGVYIDTNERLNVDLGDPADGTFAGLWKSTTAVTLENVTHYAFTFSSGSLAVYVNGLEIAGSVTSGSIPATLYNNTADLTWGSSLSSNSVVNHWEGQIFDARIYDGTSTVLTADEILSTYNNPSANINFDGQTLAAHYKLAEGAGTQILDASGNGNHGTIENAGSNWGTLQDVYHANINTGCGKRMYFDGADDYVNVGNDSSLKITGDLTFSCNVFTESDSSQILYSAYGPASLYPGFGVGIGITGGARRINVWTGFSLGWLDSGYTIPKNIEKKVTVTYRSSDFQVLVYVDDVLEATLTGQALGTNTSDTSIGKFISGSAALKGSIRDIKIYNVLKSASEIINLNTDTTGLVSHWIGYGNTDADWTDQVGSNDGTVNGSPSALYLPSSDTTPSQDVLGGTLTNPAVNGHNDAETDINFNPDSVPINANIVTTNDGNGSSYVEIPDNAAFDITDNLTVMCWAKNDASALPATEYIITKYDFGATQREWAMLIPTTEKLQVNFGDPADGTLEGTWISDNVVPNTNQWHHYAFTFSGGTVQLYVDGVAVSGSVFSGSIPSTLYNGTANVSIFTELNSGAGANYWNGSIQHCRIYSGTSTVLTAAQVLQCKEQSEKLLTFSGQTLVCAPELMSDTLDWSGNNLHGENNGITFTKYTVPTAYSFGDTLTATYNHFKREKSAVQEDRFLLYRESLEHNSKLSQVENYTA